MKINEGKSNFISFISPPSLVVRCPPLFAPSNGQVTLEQGQGSCGGGAVLGSACQVTCSHGYNLQSEGDSENLTCEQSAGGTTVGVWNGSVPLCQSKFIHEIVCVFVYLFIHLFKIYLFIFVCIYLSFFY